MQKCKDIKEKKIKKQKTEKDASVPLTQEYMDYHKKYVKEYGEDTTIVLIQVGGFYEAYALPDIGPDLVKLSKITGVTKTKKDKSLHEITLTNPHMLGFPIGAIGKYTEMLLENDYVVILIDQTGNDKDPTGKIKGKERKVSHIYTRGTFIENIEKKDGNFIVCSYLSNEDSLLCTGLVAMDVSTGHVYIHEAYSTKNDESFALDEIDRFVATFNPQEIIIYFNQEEKKMTKKNILVENQNSINQPQQKMYSKDYILTYLQLNEIGTRFYENVDKKYFNCNCQNEIFQLVYQDTQSLVTPIEQLDLEKNLFVNASLALIFDYTYNKNSLLTSDLMKPAWFTDSKKLVLGNNAVRQLDIIEDLNNQTKSKFRSLFHVVNKTSTAMGERHLKQQLLSPNTDITELNKSYDQIEIFIENNYFYEIEKFLDGIKDIERLQKKIFMKVLKPIEIQLLVSSYENIIDLIFSIKNKKCTTLLNLLPSEQITNKISDFLKHIEIVFKQNELEKYANYEFKTNIFNEKIYSDIDDLHKNVNNSHNELEKFREHLDNLIKTTSTNCINIKKNNKDGYYLQLSNANALKLKLKLEKIKVLNISGLKINSNSLQFKEATKVTKILIPSLSNEEESEEDPEDYEKQFMDLIKRHFFDELEKIKNLYEDMFRKVNSFVAKIDFLKSGAKLAVYYNYTKPNILNKKKNNNSFIKATNLRHPIIERINQYEYVPHSFELGNELKGMLLFGINACGKSSLMKSIGLSIVLAQTGLYVPAEKFTYYPYNSLYTRIAGDDNIFRGLSSFTLELVEVNAILKRSGKNTLVIGDEVCRGTENISGNALVASTIIKLSQSESTFIFATHLHELLTIKKIQSLTNLKSFYLDVKYDPKTQALIYDRTLKEGSCDKIYGIMVAQYIIKDNDFIDTALEIKNELLESYDSMLGSGKTSNYNKNIMVYKCNVCGICDKNMCVTFLESHHIGFQKDCKNGFVKNKQHIKKNQEANITILCQTCHDKVHSGKIEIEGYKMTSNGKSLMVNYK